MSQPQNKAGSIESKGQPIKVIERPTPTPSANQILVKTHAIAINPVDHYIRDQGGLIQSWPAILGSDVAGEILEVGSEVTSLKKGDRVAVSTTYLISGNSDEAGFQLYFIAPEVTAFKIPDDLSFADAVVVPLSAATAAAGLYQKKHLGLDLPVLGSGGNQGEKKKLLIWGAGSSVAASAIQLAVASGYEVITTASPKHFEYAKGLGAAKVFDYRSSSIVGDLTAELQEGTFVGAYDAISTRDTQLSIATIIAQLGGGKIAAVLPTPDDEIPSTVESKMVFATAIFAPDESVGKAVFQDFLPGAIASGQFVPRPKAEVVGQGLEALDGALDKHRAGVSATKLVVTI